MTNLNDFRERVDAELDGITYDKLAKCCCNFNNSGRNSKIVLEYDRVAVLGFASHDYMYTDFSNKEDAMLTAMLGVMFLGGWA